jgi:hypothetical protein
MLMVFLVTASWAQTATVTTDKPDYAPRSTAIFTGSGFAPFEQVVLKVKNLNQPCHTVSADSSYLAWSVPADGSGGFTTEWTVCDCPGDSLRLKATGQSSGAIAYAYFTDGNISINGSNNGATVSCPGTSVTLAATNFNCTGTPGGGFCYSYYQDDGDGIADAGDLLLSSSNSASYVFSAPAVGEYEYYVKGWHKKNQNSRQVSLIL